MQIAASLPGAVRCRRVLGRDTRIGTLAAGAHADLLVVDGDPLEDISVPTRPQECLKHVIKAGIPA